MGKTEIKRISEQDEQIVNEYFLNGYNKTKAVLAVRPDMDYFNASKHWAMIKQRPSFQKLMDEKRARLTAATDVRQEQILRELIQFAYSDARDYIALTPQEIKELPPDVGRCIQSYKHKSRTFYDKDIKQHVTEHIIEIRLVDKLNAIKEINKHIGFYDADNRQKRQTINIDKVDNVTLNNLLQVLDDSSK